MDKQCARWTPSSRRVTLGPRQPLSIIVSLHLIFFLETFLPEVFSDQYFLYPFISPGYQIRSEFRSEGGKKLGQQHASAPDLAQQLRTRPVAGHASSSSPVCKQSSQHHVLHTSRVVLLLCFVLHLQTSSLQTQSSKTRPSDSR